MNSQPTIGEYLGTHAQLRAVVARQVASTVRESDMLSEVLARFWARCRCNRCLAYGWCAHRSRTADVRLILGGRDSE